MGENLSDPGLTLKGNDSSNSWPDNFFLSRSKTMSSEVGDVAKDLPCIFASLEKDRPGSNLAKCKTEGKQKWRHASAEAAAKRITEMAKYFSELIPLLDSLECYSLCEPSFVDSDESKRKRLKTSNANDKLQFEETFVDRGTQVEKTFVDFEAQVSFPDPCCEIFLRRISELESLNRQLLAENEVLKKKLNGRFTDQQDRSNLAKCKTEGKQKWRHASAEAAAKRITEMAKYFSELIPLLDSLESKTGEPSFVDSDESKRKRLKTSNANDKLQFEETFVDRGTQVEKTFVDFEAQVSFPDPCCEIFLRRISELESLNRQLLAENEVLKKKLNGRFTDQKDHIQSIVEIAKKERNNLYEDVIGLMKNQERFHLDNLLEYSPSKWLAERNPVIVKFIQTLAYNENENQLEGEKLFKCAVAIDTIYGSRHLKYVSAINLVTSAIKYSLARSKMIIDIDNHIISSGSYSKFTNWLESLATEQSPLPDGLLFLAFDNEQKGQKNYLDRGHNMVIFHIVTSMKNEIHEELTNYLSIILDELLNEKNQKTNVIDDMIHYQSQTGCVKKCSVCQASNIDNKKRICPTCHNKLPTINEMNQQLNEPSNIINTTEKYKFKESNKQKSVPEVYTPQIFVPDPIGINPNSIANVRKVLEHIEEISGIKDNRRKWIVVTCD
ncbi:hypothetical protein Glove_13g299 [Diversispora epigaea]|uniref:Uncharacterized protein n=1 Tax=Diversispora epigaea TaxID=1348612 RepID=A0A397JMJ0_9GLOM|nr:hypothetical protein Glove_13g299 [Diversispora epigaea]